MKRCEDAGPNMHDSRPASSPSGMLGRIKIEEMTCPIQDTMLSMQIQGNKKKKKAQQIQGKLCSPSLDEAGDVRTMSLSVKAVRSGVAHAQ